MTTDDKSGQDFWDFWTRSDYPKMKRSVGVTESERYLKELCDHSFLSLWSYPGVFRDQGRVDGKGDGKEVCDLLVVFEEHIIIFSDKHCHFADSGDLEFDWSRWYKKAVLKSAEQIWGAERWIRDFPARLFLDRQCKVPFPISLPDSDKAKFHRIVVSHDAARRCRAVLGGSGSMMLQSTLDGAEHLSQPFKIGNIDRRKGFVHVLDDTSLDIVMSTLDTITDFVSYLDKKEQLMTGKLPVFAAGEEELLAQYLFNSNANDEHDFVIPSGSAGFVLGEGHWAAFEKSPGRKAQVDANQISYFWDSMIEWLLGQMMEGTIKSNVVSISEHEKSFRWMARENRTRRRILTESFLGLIQKTPNDFRASRIVKATRPGEPYYIFLLLPHYPTWTREEYRRIRVKMLAQYCVVVKSQFPDAQHVVGIASESGKNDPDSLDATHLDPINWTPELAKEARSLKRSLGIFTDPLTFSKLEWEFPLGRPQQAARISRNSPCFCGSGKRYKRCCGLGMFGKKRGDLFE
jgi:hypothetical protein